MAKKDLKLNIKNTQIAEAIQLDKLKERLAGKKAGAPEIKKAPSKAPSEKAKKLVAEEIENEEKTETPPRRKARTKSVFAEKVEKALEEAETVVEESEAATVETVGEQPVPEPVFSMEKEPSSVQEEVSEVPSEIIEAAETSKVVPDEKKETAPIEVTNKAPKFIPKREVLGPTGRHIKDLLPPKPIVKHVSPEERRARKPGESQPAAAKEWEKRGSKGKEGVEPREKTAQVPVNKDKGVKFKEFKDVKPTRRGPKGRFDSRGRLGLGESEEDQKWRKKRQQRHKELLEETTIRPTELSIRLPISIKDLAVAMKLKSSQLISKLFLQGIIVTINDMLDDETTIVLLGEEFGCAITIDTSEEERLRITDQTIREEIAAVDPSVLKTRAPVVTFMGHVDHGKTSLIDYIRKSNRAAGEAGEITQHIGAFLCMTAVGNIAILDTPGHEAFSAMRARGADVTDIVVLVVAGDEGFRPQTEEAIAPATAAKVNIVVAINKCDKPNYNPENVYRQLSEHELLPESWGGQTITINCSAVTGEGIKELLEMLALQAEVLELKANPSTRARGTVLESELHKGMGPVATILVQNGTLRIGDAVVFGEHYGSVKTMHDEFGGTLTEAPPSTPVEITGISGLPEAGLEFIVVANDKEARAIAEGRMIGKRQLYLQQSKKTTLENLFQQASEQGKKFLNIVLRADVQGSLEALKAALMKIESDKVDLNIISSAVGEISESDVLLAAASKAMILGFHTKVESHAESLLKQYGIKIILHDIIYHAIDDVKSLMAGTLDKIAQENEKGKAEVRAIFKSSRAGVIAGCMITEGSIHRNNQIRVVRDGAIVWKGSISSLKREKEDVREVQKGIECGILLSGFNEVQEGDILEACEITYITQGL